MESYRSQYENLRSNQNHSKDGNQGREKKKKKGKIIIPTVHANRDVTLTYQ